MIKKNKRLLALLVSVSVVTTSVILPSQRTFALGDMIESMLNSSETKVDENDAKMEENVTEQEKVKEEIDKSKTDVSKGDASEGETNKDKDETSSEDKNKVDDKSENNSKDKLDTDKNVIDNIKPEDKDKGKEVNDKEVIDKENNEKDKDKEVAEKDKESKEVIEDSKEATDVISIEEALKMKEGESATVEGIVSFKDNKTLYIQDETGGIAISNYKTEIKFDKVKKGNKVKVTGKKGEFHKLAQLQVKEIKVTEENFNLKPETVTISELKSGKYDSKYVSIENAIFDEGKASVDESKDSKNEKIFVLKQNDESIDIFGNISGVKVGDRVNVKGTMGRFGDTIQIYGKSCTFIKTDIGITHKNIEMADINEDLNVEADLTGIEISNVDFYYKVIGSKNFEKLEMVKGENNKYNITLLKEKLDLKGMEYYIYAKDKNGETKTDIYSMKVTNGIAPEIYDMLPGENSRVSMKEFSEIKALIKSDKGIDINSVKVYLDDKDVTANSTIKNDSIQYVPSEKPTFGSHKVKVEVKDIVNNVTTKEWTFRVFDSDAKLKHLFGQLHAHTNISDGSGSLDEAYKWVKENKADYYAVTDHSNWFDNDTEANLGDGSKSEKWTKAHETADKYNDPGKFTAIYGYEMTWSGSTGGWGHINTFNTPGFETRTNKAMDLQNYYKTIQTQPQSISQLNHPGKTFGDFADFGFYSEGVDKNVNLIEVGNGEGPIRGSGYFPSYEYYTRALDKGWHVAPTNSQDNHKGNWFTSNNARTIVIADDNSRDSIYDALREKRVYASEDTDMTIDYTVNDEIMGTSLGNVDGKLNFKINATDPTDKIKKISIIANGGVEVESKTFNDNNANWELTLDPEYSYYYVKVVQEDKDISVTSPVWVGDALNVGLSNAKVDTDMTLPGENVELNVGFFNNGEKGVKDVKFEFFKNNINADSKIGEKVVESVASTKTENVKFNWKADKEGEYTLYAKATVKLDKGEKSFTTSAKVKIVNPEKVKKVLVDGSHYNQYVTGDYTGKYTAFKSLLTEKDGLTVINKDKITDEILKDVKILVLTNPQSTENTTAGLKASKFDNDEIQAIKRYVEKGGNVIVSTRADYKDGKGEYSNGAQMNSVLEAIGTKLRVNDDEVIDTTNNGGQEYRLYLTNYDSPNYNLLNGVKKGEDQYSFYNGASVVLADGASPEGVDFLVKGFETTETKDADGDKDNVEVPKGNVNMLGVEQLSNGGKVVVSGNTFFSDFEIDGTNGDKYSNVKITNNIVNWMMPSKEIKTIKLGDIRKDSNNDGTPDLYGQKVTVEGYVTSQSEAVEPKNSFFEVVYITDETGGACVFGVSSTKLKVGQKVRITGVVDAYQGELEISLADRDSGPVSGNIESKNVQILDENIVDVKPVELSTKDSMLPSNGGKLVKVQGKVVRMDKQNLYIDDGSGESRVYVEGYIWDGINKEESLGKWDKNIEVGDNVSAIGLASWDPENGRLRVRNTGEIKFQENVTSKHWENKDLTRNRVN
ncbi:DUF3604 domain-containing protein [Clostridium botulinum]|nr:DUF3604 domain-containing protein [Clostridium botulinum]